MSNNQQREVKDTSYKLLFDNNELFVEFMRDYVQLPILDDLRPEDVENVSTRYPSVEHDEIDSDTVKKIRLKDGSSMFIITTIEHESRVNFRTSYKLMRYMVEIWYLYEKEMDTQANKPDAQVRKRPSRTKDFMYPPIVPIVFFDGPGAWTAEMNFVNKVWLHDIFRHYIPSFEYILVDLNKYDRNALLKFGDTISFLLLLAKIHSPEDLSLITDLPQAMIAWLNKLPDSMKDLITEVFRSILRKAKVPEADIDDLTYQIKERRYSGMFEYFETLNVTESLQREQALKQELHNALQREQQERQQGQQTIQKLQQERQQERQTAIAKLRAMGLSDEQIAQAMGL
jgi:hypothetical protein